MTRSRQLALFLLVLSVHVSPCRTLHAGDLQHDHGLIPNTTYDSAEAANNTKRLVAAIELGVPLTCEFGGSFWFDDPLPLPPAYRRNNTAYVVGDRVRGDISRIYVCISGIKRGHSTF
jgi:hypothetical protein